MINRNMMTPILYSASAKANDIFIKIIMIIVAAFKINWWDTNNCLCIIIDIVPIRKKSILEKLFE